MRYTVVGIRPIDLGKFEITFSNGKTKESINVTSFAKDTWCLYNESGKPIKFYSSIEDLIDDFEDNLNKDDKG